MKQVKLNSVKKNNETSVSNIFLDNYMRDANGEFVKVYLYLLRCMDTRDAAVTLSDIADRLNLTEKDVVRALKYWVGVKVIDAVLDKETGEPVSLTFLPLDTDTIDTQAEVAAPVKTEAATPVENRDKVKAKGTHTYSPAKIKRLKEKEDFVQILYVTEQYFEKPLTQTELGILSYIYDDLQFSAELIDYLLEYCVNGGHKSFHYLEAVALAWDEKGIKTVDEAKASSVIRSERTAVVAKGFGIAGRNLTSSELEFINRWYDEYGFDKEMVAEACKRTIMTMSKPNFSYTDGILKKWKDANIYTIDSLKTLDAGFRAKFTVPVSTKPPKTQPVNNRFNNFTQRTYSLEELESKLISNR